jgi:hypothetical protein
MIFLNSSILEKTVENVLRQKKDPHQNIQPTSVTELNEQTEDTQKTNDHT